MPKPSPPEIASFLSQTGVFRGCPQEALNRVAPHLEHRTFSAGEALLRQSATVAGLGIMLAGRATVRLPSTAGAAEVAIEELSSGDCFGEVGLLLGGVNPLVVVAEEDGEALVLLRQHFEQILNVLPTFGAAIARRLSQRIVRMGVIGSRGSRPASGSNVPVAAPRVTDSGGVLAVPHSEIRFVEVAEYAISNHALDLLPSKLIQLHRMLPLELRGRTLVVGMVNPKSIEARQELRRVLSNVEPEIVAISQDDFNQTVVRLKLDVSDRAGAAAVQRIANQRPSYHTDQRRDSEKVQVVIGDEIVHLLDRILAEGIERGASDVHIEPDSQGVRVRYRVQGMLHERKEIISASFASPLIARIKVLSEMDITERRLPQDGRIGASLGRRELNFRISTLMAVRGEKIVIRIIDPMAAMRPLEHIFLDPQVAETVQLALTAPHGAIVVGGPTGAGKSATLYSMINNRKAARPDNNLVTVEDPVEFLFPGITQVQVNTRVGLDYADVLRAMLRQDPDVIMIGELRDAATAAIIIEAALTGHLVLTSMHASTAVAVLQRLGHLGMDSLLLAQALNLIVVQRLARRPCPHCVRDEEVAPALIEHLVARQVIARGGAVKLPRPVGCEQCDRTGYKGRLAVIELLALDDELRHMITVGANPTDLLAHAAASGHFVPFSRSAALLMARRLLCPADALLAVAG